MSRRFVLAAALVSAGPMTMKRIGVLSAWVLSLAALNAQSTPQQRPPVFRSDANLVQVDAYPMKDGRIVTNLEKGDFEILEDGKPQKIEGFELVKVEPFTPDAEKRDPNTQEEGNELAADPKNRVFVVYLDHLNVSVGGAYRTRAPLVQMLNRIMAPNDLFGVITPDMRPRDLVFGRKVGTTEDMLARYWAWGERGSILRTPEEGELESCTIDPGTGKPVLSAEGAAVRPMIDILVERRREDKVLTHLEDLIDYLAGVRETRKSLIVFTEGWLLFEPDEALEAPLRKLQDIPVVGLAGGRPTMSSSSRYGSRAGCAMEVQRLARLSDGTRFRGLVERARRANVVFYPVNPLGLTTFDYPINQQVYANATVYERDPNASVLKQDLDRLHQREDAIIDMAHNTGGIAVVNTNDLNAGLDRIASQLSAYYVLSYYSTNPKFDGRFRQIDVKLKVPGLSVTARRGYLAPTEAEMAARTAPKPIVAPAVEAGAGDLAAALGTLSRIRPNADLYGWGVVTKPAELTVVAEVAARHAEVGKWMAGADLQVVVTSVTGEMAGSARARLAPSVRGTAVKIALPAGSTGPWHVQLRLKDGDELIETTAEVAAPSASASRKLLGDPIVYRAAPGAQSALAPVADFLFRRTERVHVEWATNAALDAREARLLDRAGNPLPVQVTLGEKPGAVLAADVNLAPLGPGDYVIELSVSGGGASVKTKLAIRVQN